MRLSTQDFLAVVHEALADIPPELAACMENVVVDVEPLPDARDCAEAGVDDPRDLLGLYTGTPLTCRTNDDTGALPDRIILYQRNLEAECRTRRELIREIRKTVFHEVGHHFGLEEEDLDRLGFA